MNSLISPSLAGTVDIRGRTQAHCGVTVAQSGRKPSVDDAAFAQPARLQRDGNGRRVSRSDSYGKLTYGV